MVAVAVVVMVCACVYVYSMCGLGNRTGQRGAEKKEKRGTVEGTEVGRWELGVRDRWPLGTGVRSVVPRGVLPCHSTTSQRSRTLQVGRD
jgi:hypothetical protein